MVSFQSNAPIPNSGYAVATGTDFSDPFITVFATRNPNANDFNYPVKKRWINLTPGSVTEWVLTGFTNVSGQSLAIWIEISATTAAVLSLSDNVNTVVFPSGPSAIPPDNIQFTGQLNEQGGSVPSPFQTIIANPGNHLININPMSGTRWIVDPLSISTEPNGTHTTIQSAINSASKNDTIILMPGTYTENLTLKDGLNIVALSDNLNGNNPQVGIFGNHTFSTGGNFVFFGIRFVTTTGTTFTLGGAAQQIMQFCRCTFNNGTGQTVFRYTNSSDDSELNLLYCDGAFGNSGSQLFSMTSLGVLKISYTYITNSDGSSMLTPSTTASTISAGKLYQIYSDVALPVTTSGTSSSFFYHDDFTFDGSMASTNLTWLTIGGSGTNNVYSSYFSSGTASCISIGSTCTVTSSTIVSSNGNALTGGGTINYGGLVFAGSSSTNGVTTKNLLTVT